MPRGNRPPYPYDCMVDGVGLMLSTGADGTVAWRERKLDFFAPRVSQTDQSYAQFPPEDETTWAVDDLSGGYGQRAVPRGGSTGYAHGLADTRIPYQVTLPPEVVTTPITASGAITDHFELDDVMYVLTGSAIYRSRNGRTWTLTKAFEPGVTARSAAVFKGRAERPMAFVAVGGSVADEPFWTFDGTTWTQHAGQFANPTAVLRTGDSGQTYADLTHAVSDADAGTYGHLDSLGAVSDGAWLLVGGKAPFAAVAIEMNAAANGNAAELAAEYWNGLAWTTVDELSDGTAQGGKTLARDGDVRFEEPANWRETTINGLEAFWLRLTVGSALDSSTRINELAVREVRKADAFLVIGSQLARVSGETGAPRLSTSMDGGVASTWSSGAPVGDGASAANALVSLDGTAYVVKEDGLYAQRPGADGGAVAEHAWSQRARDSSPYSGRGSAVWRGYLWLPMSQGLYRFRSGDLKPVGPERLRENDSPIRGRITACAGDAHFLYAALRDETGQTTLLAFNPDQRSWHPLARLGQVDCRHLWVSDRPGPNPRLYVGVGGSLATMVLPRGSANPLHDPNCRFAASAEVYLSRFDAAFAAQPKAFLALTLSGDRLTASTWVDVAYRLAAGARFEPLGRFAASGQRIEFGSKAAATAIDLRLTLHSDDPTTTPVVHAASLAYAIRADFKRVFQFVVRIADQAPLRDGRRDRRSGRVIKQAIAAAAATREPVVLVSPDGEHIEALVRGAEAQGRRSEAGRDLEWLMPVTATEYRPTAGTGTHNRLAAYAHQAQAAYLHTQLARL
ncbi:MAG: hypothetical protein F4Y02_18630 [Chloroflexi bacterium]|nr:hypothetical protein [Chloroflexota bacterium]